MVLPVNNGTIFSTFLTDQNLTPILNKIGYNHVTKIPRDDGLLSEPTTEVNGNDPSCKRVLRVVIVHFSLNHIKTVLILIYSTG